MVMKNITEEMKFVSGYPGEDSMRAKAHKLLSHEFETTPMTKPASRSTPSHEKMRIYKKGGHVKHLSHGGRADHKEHHDENEAGGHLTNLHLPKPMRLNVEKFKEATGMRKGGRAHDHKKCAVKRARGGSVYEKDMLGEHPSHKRPHINYESEMMGETPERKAEGGKPLRRPSNVMDASHGQYKKKGGAVKKMAAGGVAKIRHGVATKSGQPIGRKLARGY